LRAGYTLHVPPVEKGRIVLCELSAPVNAEQATQRVARARRAVHDFDSEVQSLEQEVDRIDTDAHPEQYVASVDKLSAVKYRRFQSACVWRANAAALANSEPQNEAFAAQAEEARQAVHRFVVPPRHGLAAE
jgi:hypothetical protein